MKRIQIPIQVWRGLALVFVVALTVGLYLCRDQVNQIGVYGYPGIFLISILANATIILPVPGLLITSAMGAIFDPFWVAVASGCGAAVGELSGYLAGFSGQGVVENTKTYEKLTGWMKKYGEPTVFVLAFIPSPLFDMAGMIAGALKMPVVRFLIWCALGKILKMWIAATFGATLEGWIHP